MTERARIEVASLQLYLNGQLIPATNLVLEERGDPAAVYLASLRTEKSRRAMRGALATIAKTLGAPSAHVIPWGSLRYMHVEALMAHLAARYAPATVGLHLAALRGVALAAFNMGLLSSDEYVRIRSVKGARGERLPAGRHIERPELEALFKVCTPAAGEPSAADVRDTALLAVLRFGGVRRSELAALELKDLDRRSFVLRVLGKGNKEREVFLGAAREELEAWLAIRGEEPGPLFCAVSETGRLSHRRLADSSVAFILVRAARRAGLEHVSPHDMRRTFVGDLLDEGADLRTVQGLAGHSDVRTTARYDRRGRRAAEKAAALLPPPPRRQKANGAG